jgi:hypothetical protein
VLDAADGARERSARGKRIAIVQSSYVPWKGYFDLMRRVDELVLLDDAQFTRRDWRNRNRIKTPQGPRWLTIPVEAKGKSRLAIREIRASDPSWPQRHWETVRHAYTRAPCFESFGPRIHELYRSVPSEMLSEINHHFLAALRDMLHIDARLTWSTDYASSGRKSERLVSICTKAGATEYLSGPSARAYLDEDLFGAEGIDVIWMDYREYPEYEQLHPPFDHHVSVLDLLLHTGDRAVDYMLPDRGR